MRVARFSEFGGPEKLRIEEIPDPTPGEGEIVICVAAVGLNFFDTLVLRNRYQVTPKLPIRREQRWRGRSRPSVLGFRAFSPAKGSWLSPAAMAPKRRWRQGQAMQSRSLTG